jgi:hypothetical protein
MVMLAFNSTRLFARDPYNSTPTLLLVTLGNPFPHRSTIAFLDPLAFNLLRCVHSTYLLAYYWSQLVAIWIGSIANNGSRLCCIY